MPFRSQRRRSKGRPVSVALKTPWHRNRDKPWSANDIYDIDAMAPKP
jgi:hypothetical protein